MAKIIHRNLINSVNFSKIRSILLLFFIDFVLLCGVLFSYKYKNYLIISFIFIIAFIINFIFYKKIKILEAGYLGEKETLILLKTLPNSFSIISDITINYKNRKAQIDHLIFTPKCIFILEVKNYSGELKGNITDNTLTQIKNTNGKIISKIVKNPFKQVENQSITLNNIINDNGLNIPIKYALYFSNNNFKSYPITKAKVFMHKNSNDLINELSTFDGKKTYDYKRISNLIKKYK